MLSPPAHPQKKHGSHDDELRASGKHQFTMSNDASVPQARFEVEETLSEDLEVLALPAADRGRQAYAFLCGGFVIEAILWGT